MLIFSLTSLEAVIGELNEAVETRVRQDGREYLIISSRWTK